MNTEGHAQVAEEAGLPLLRAFFGGQNLRSLEAMRLGNWLTDVSQAVDPVAYAMAANSGKDVADSIVALRGPGDVPHPPRRRIQETEVTSLRLELRQGHRQNLASLGPCDFAAWPAARERQRQSVWRQSHR